MAAMRTDLQTLLATSCVVVLFGCSDGSGAGANSAAASAAKSAPAKPAATTAAPATASAAPTASALPPRSDCPKDSEGAGTLDQPCEAKGTARMMDAKWTNKTDDKGPFFSVQNKSQKPILYGKIAVYFYDKDGKQLEAKVGDKNMPYLVCAGSNLFSGVMKVDEKATIQFSCVKKEDVPEGATAIEGEIVTVGFADSTDKAVEYYWRNKELSPDARPKGGAK